MQEGDWGTNEHGKLQLLETFSHGWKPLKASSANSSYSCRAMEGFTAPVTPPVMDVNMVMFRLGKRLTRLHTHGMGWRGRGSSETWTVRMG